MFRHFSLQNSGNSQETMDINNKRPLELRKDMYIIFTLGFLSMVFISPFFDNQDQLNIYSGFISLTFKNNLYYSYLYSYPPLAEFLDWPSLSLLSYFYPVNNWTINLVLAKSVTERITFLSTTVFSPLFNLFYKLPMILATIGTSIILFGTLQKLGYSYLTAKRVTVFYLFNPFVLYEASVHSPIDCYVPFILLVFIYSLFRKQPFLSGLISSFGALVILLPAYLLVLSLFYYLVPLFLDKNHRLKNVMKTFFFLVAGASIPIMLTLPYLENFIFLSHLSVTSSSLIVNLSNIDFWGALNSSFGIFPISSNNFTVGLSMSLRILDLLIFSIIGIVMGVNVSRTSYISKSIYQSNLFLCTMAMIILFLTTTGSTPQALIWFLVLILILSVEKPVLFVSYVLLSIWGLMWEVLFLAGPLYYLLSFSTFFYPSWNQLLITLTLSYWNLTWGSSLHFFLWNFTSIFGGSLIFFTIYLMLRKERSSNHYIK
jgi:hypothetical protein